MLQIILSSYRFIDRISRILRWLSVKAIDRGMRTEPTRGIRLRPLIRNNQFLLDFQSLGERLLNRFPEHAEMSHLTAGTAFHFPV